MDIRLQYKYRDIINAIRALSEDRSLTPRQRLELFQKAKGEINTRIKWENGTLAESRR